MPRNISAASLATIAQRTGIEPVNIIKIQWTAGGQYHYYSDREIPGQVEGKLLSLDDLEAVLDIAKSGSTTSVKVKLTDTDGFIKEIFNYNDIHARPVAIYQWFSELPLNEMFLLFEGVIASPIVWDEANRSISFDVITKLEDVSIGFSVEDGSFINVPELIIGKVWPLVFGTVVNMPTLRMDDFPTGTTRIPIGIPDHNLKRQINYFDTSAMKAQSTATCLTGRASFMGLLRLYEKEADLRDQAREMQRSVHSIQPQKERLSAIERDQKKYDVSIIPIINGHKFRQGITIEIEINSAHYVGIFQGDNFLVSSRRSPDEPVHLGPGGKQLTEEEAEHEEVIQKTQEAFDKMRSQDTPGILYFDLDYGSPLMNNAFWPCEPPYFRIIYPSNVVFDGFNNHQEKKFFFANAGASVSVGNLYPIRYILSIIPGVTVHALAAKRTVGGLKVISPIPPFYYSISQVAYGNVIATIATFNQPLSRIKDQDWEDEVYATLTSPVGPNIVDIMIWAIQTYTTYGIDSTSFNYVRNKQVNYPANFPLLQKKDLTDFLKEIAWQARCAIWLSNGKFYIKYLSEEAPAVDTLTNGDIEQQTLEVTTTNTEDLTTKLVAKWKYDYSKDHDNKIIFTYNINKYGVHEKEYDFYIYNSAELVIKSGNFWLVRLANVWKILKCKAFLTKLKVETLDTVTVNLSALSDGRHIIANVPVAGIAEKATFDSDDFSIDFDIWTPVRLGEMYPYIFAYPANIGIQYIFPTEEDIAGGFTSDTPFDAEGDFGVGYGTTSSSQRSGRTTQRAPSDSSPADSSLPPILTTTLSPYEKIYGSQPPKEKPPSYDYRFPPIVHPGVGRPTPTGTGAVTIGYIVSRNTFDDYVVDHHPNGISEEAVRLYNVRIAKIDETDEIPEGTPVYVVKLSTPDGTEYVAQPPTWM